MARNGGISKENNVSYNKGSIYNSSKNSPFQ